MDEKKSFVMYNEWGIYFEMLSVEEQGLLISAVFKYQNTGEIPEFNRELQIPFLIMKSQFDRDCEKWNNIRKQRSESGKKGATTRWSKLQEKNNLEKLDDLEELNTLEEQSCSEGNGPKGPELVRSLVNIERK